MKNKKEGVSKSMTHPLFISSFHLSFVITNLGFHELLGSSELVSHHAQEFLTLLENIEINQ